MTQPLRPGPDSADSADVASADAQGGRHLVRRTIGAGAAVLVTGSALAIGLQAAVPDQVRAPVPASTGADSPVTSVSPAPAQPKRDRSDDDDEDEDEAGVAVTKVVRVPSASRAPAPAPVAVSGGSGG